MSNLQVLLYLKTKALVIEIWGRQKEGLQPGQVQMSRLVRPHYAQNALCKKELLSTGNMHVRKSATVMKKHKHR